MATESKTGDSMKTKVAAVIDHLRPLLQADGGDIELVEVDEATGRAAAIRRIALT